jgi:hypothetical protein
MKTNYIPAAVGANASSCHVTDLSIPQLVGQVYEVAPVFERGHLLEPLLRPLGVLSLLTVANGVFANIRFRSGWQDLHVRLEDVQNVRASDVIALVEYVQQVSIEAVDGLAQIVTASPMLAGSAAAGLLVAVLMQRDRGRRARSRGDGAPPPSTPA